MTARSVAITLANAVLLSAFLAMTDACLAQPIAASADSSASSGPRGRYALLIGITDYQSSNLRSLQGPENDLRLVQEVLISRFKVPPPNITVLKNKQATHTGIERAFAQLAKQVKKGDFVYIHYSGHGSTTPDPKDPKGEDQTWVSYGARSGRLAGNDDLDILDKEIAVWLKPLYEQTDDIVFVSDSCHSATVSRGEALGTRAVGPDARTHPLLGKLPVVPAPTTGLRIGAARDVESAVELDSTRGGMCTQKEHCVGVFTWNWTQSLQQAQPGDRWVDIFSRTFTLVTSQAGVSQRPQLEGISERTVLGGNFPRLPATVSVTEVKPDGSVILGAGSASQVTKKSTYRRFDSGNAGGADLPTLEVTSVEPFRSEARVTKGRFRVADAVTEVKHVYSFKPIRLYVGGDFASSVDAKLVQGIRDSLKALAGFDLVDARSEADWWVYIVRSAAAAPADPGASGRRLPGGAFPPDPKQPAVAWVVSPQGVLAHERMRIPLTDPAEGINTLTGNLAKFAWSREVKGLAARGNALPLELAVTILSQAQDGPARGPYPLTKIDPKPKYGDWLSFQLKNKDSQSRSWYAYVFAVTPGAAVKRLHPRRADSEDEARLTQGQSVPVSAKYHVNEEGIETILLVVAENPIRPELFESPGYQARGETPKSQLQARLNAGAHRRGDVEVGPDEWGIVSTDIAITKPNPKAIRADYFRYLAQEGSDSARY